MTIEKLYSVSEALGKNEKTKWRNKILQKVQGDLECILQIPLGALALSAYSCFDASYDLRKRAVIAYGAGQAGRQHIPKLASKIEITEIWDAYSQMGHISGIPIYNGIKEAEDKDALIIVFIDDRVIRYEIINSLKKKGYENIFYFREYSSVLEWMERMEAGRLNVMSGAKECIEELCEAYEVIEGMELPVTFSVLPVSLKNDVLEQKDVAEGKSKLRMRLEEELTVSKVEKNQWIASITAFENADWNTMYSLAYNLELFLRSLLSLGIKTKERPLRMERDNPYDEFAAYTVLNAVWELLWNGYDNEYILKKLHGILETVKTTVPFQASECYFQMRAGKWQEALEAARRMVKRDSNDLLINEVLYQAILGCKARGIPVDEPTPEYNLSERFCWCGINFAWCGGFNSKNGQAEFGPCFRPLQCAARPEGEFWSGEDWKEFRKSVTDGTFRYCQKNQCPNIVGGWLPKKSDCTGGWLQQILEGDLDVIPPLEELHFSYDGHCNLKCPSCRLDIRTNTCEQIEKLNELYKKNLAPYMKKAKHLTLSGCGEAILSPHSKAVLQSFSREENPELVIELRTNATVLNSRTWEALGEGRHLIRHITASIDAATKESFEKLRYPAKWEMVLKSLKFVQSLRNAGEIDLFEFHVVISTENINQLYDIAQMAIEYDADAITYSKMINWREMPEEEYDEVNPFWSDHPRHEELQQELKRLEELRADIEAGRCDRIRNGKKVYITLHFRQDPNSSYDDIRWGKLKIR